MKPKSTLRFFLCIATSAVLTISYSHAADGTWNVDADGLWSDAGNWTPGIADLSGFTANFTNDITADRTVTLDGSNVDRTLTNVVFGDSDTLTAGSWLLNSSATTNNLILAGTTPGITVNALGTGKTATISAIIQGSVGLIKSGTGTLILTGANTYTGATAINAGTLQIGNGGTIASTSIVVTSPGNLTINRSDALDINTRVISGTGSVTLTNAAPLTLNNTISNNYSGGFTLTSGQVGGMAVGTYNGFGTGLLTINGGSMRGPNTSSAIVIPNEVAWNANVGFGRAQGGTPIFTFNGNVTLGASVAASTASGSEPYTLAINGNISQSSPGYGITYGSANGGGGMFLNGQNTFTGAINTGAFQLTIGGSGYLGGGSYAGAISSGALTYSSSANQTLSGVISGSGTLTKGTSSSSVLTLSGANTYTGATTVNQGTLKAGIVSVATVSGAFGKDSAVTLANNAGVTLDLAGFATRIGSLTGGGTTGGTVTSSTGSAILTLGNLSNATTTFGGIFSGNVGLTKNGTGTFTMTGANNYTGLTSVTDGTVAMTAPSTMGGLSVTAAKSFVYAPTTAGALNIGGTYTLGSAVAVNTALGGTLSQSVIAATGAASLSGTGVVNIRLVPSAAPALGTHNLITAASGLDGGTSYTLGAVYNNTDFTLSNYTRSATAISIDVASATALSGNVLWKGGLTGNTGVWSASNGSTTSNWQVTDGVNQPIAPGATADLVFSAATSPGTMVGMSLGANMTIRSLTINNTATAFSLNADGFGTNNTLTITPSSSSTGITIGSGVQALTIAAPLVLGADQKWTNNSANLFTVSGAINTNGNDLEIAGRTTITGLITGSGGLTKSGTGILILGNSGNSYTGKTLVTGGIIQSGIAWNNNPNSIPGGMGNASTGSNIELNGGILSMDFNLDRSLGNGPGQIQITGGRSGISTMTDPRGLWTVGGNASFEVVWGASGEGAATGFFNPSTFVMNDVAASPTYQSTLANKVDLNGANRTIEAASATYFGQMSGVIRNSTGTAGLIKTGVGQLRLTAANTYNGATTISAGTLKLDAGGSIANSPNITVASNATFDVSTRTSSLTLGSGQTLTSSATGAATTATVRTLSTKNLTLSAGGLAFSAYGGANGNLATNAPLTVTGTTAGELQMNGAPVTVTTTTSLAAGDYVLVAKSGSALVSGTPGTLTVNGSGASGTTSLAVTAGQLILTVSSGGDPYETWAGGPGVPFDGDSNGDGVSNGLAFLLGAIDKDVSALNKLPTVTQTGGGLVLNFTCLDEASRGTAELYVEHSNDLGIGDPWQASVEVDDDGNVLANGVTLSVVPNVNPGDPDLNDVTATISASEALGGKLFGRLKAVKP